MPRSWRTSLGHFQTFGIGFRYVQDAFEQHHPGVCIASIAIPAQRFWAKDFGGRSPSIVQMSPLKALAGDLHRCCPAISHAEDRGVGAKHHPVKESRQSRRHFEHIGTIAVKAQVAGNNLLDLFVPIDRTGPDEGLAEPARLTPSERRRPQVRSRCVPRRLRLLTSVTS